MSMKALAWAVDWSVAAGIDRIVLFALAVAADDVDAVAPLDDANVAAIAARVNCSDTRVRHAVESLAAIGELELLPAACRFAAPECRGGGV